MSFTSALVLYAVTWFIVLLMLLPIGVRSQEEAGDVAPGTPAGAPETPMIGRKMLWATGVAAVVWAVVYCVIVFGVITREDIRGFAPFD
ncbi:DUF1467 family protein [Rubrimonas cliftonensis]|uniref:Predicted secreted protein n=1 Tax=Rubrimonas cliftonensis TaxID=89524 RepID=A0A1H4DVH0_9RHOB|nr:DUF1467 family protein [Rubrimonas cliftonensis]SEA76741.1 Predicted secreted protein [Rubrimonas cliftonensis]